MKLKLVGDVVRKLETARFCRTLGTLIKSGVPFLQALNNAKDVIGNRIIADSIDAVTKNVREGKGVAGPLIEANVFPLLALSMIKVGEETGQLDIMLLKVASTYEKSLKEVVKRFMSLFGAGYHTCYGDLLSRLSSLPCSCHVQYTGSAFLMDDIVGKEEFCGTFR